MIGLLGIIIAIVAGALFGISAFAGAEVFKMFVRPKKVLTTSALEDKLAKKRRRFPTISKWNTIPSETSNFSGSTIDAPPSATLNSTALVTPHADPNGSNQDVESESALVVRMLLVGSTLSLYEVNEEDEYQRREQQTNSDKKWLASKVAPTEASSAKRAAAEAFAASDEDKKNAKRVPALLSSDKMLGKITLSPSVLVTMDGDDGKHQIRIERHAADDGISATTSRLNSRHIARPDKPGLFDAVPRPSTGPTAPTPSKNVTPITNDSVPEWHDIIVTFETYRETCRWYEALYAATTFTPSSKTPQQGENVWVQALKGIATQPSSSSSPVLGAVATRLIAGSLNPQGYSSAITNAFMRSLAFSSKKLQDAPIGAMAAHGVFEGYGISMTESILPISTAATITAGTNSTPSSPFAMDDTASNYTGSTALSTAAASTTGQVIGRVGAALKIVTLRAAQSNSRTHTTLASKLRLGTLCSPSEKPYDDVSDDENDDNQPPVLLYSGDAPDDAPSSATNPRTGEVSFDISASTANSRTPFIEAIFQIFVHSEPLNADYELDEAASMARSNDGTAYGKDEIRVLPPLYVYVKVECVDGRLRANIAPPSAGQSTAGATKTPELWFGFYGRPAATVTADIIDPTAYRSFYSEHLKWDVDAIRLAVKSMAAIRPYESHITTAVAEGVYAALFEELTLPHYGSLPMPVLGGVAQSSDVASAWEQAAEGLAEAFNTARLELFESQCARIYADAANMCGFSSPLRAASLSGAAHSLLVGSQGHSQLGRSSNHPQMPSSPFAPDRASLAGRSIRGGQNSVVVPWLQTQALNEPAKTVTAADVASLSKWSFPNRTPYEHSLAGGGLGGSQSASQAGGPVRPSTPLRRLYHRGPSPSPLLANEDSHMNSARGSEHRFDVESPANNTTNPLSSSVLPSGRGNPHYEESVGGGSVAMELSGFRRREEQLRAALAEARSQAAREQAKRMADEAKNDKRREEEAKRSQERLAELERRMQAEREREAKKKLQEEIDKQNDEERARRRAAEAQLQEERRQRVAEEDATTGRLANTEKAIQVLSEAIQKLAEQPRTRTSSNRRRTFSESSSDSERSRTSRRSRNSRAATPLTQSMGSGSPIHEERVNQLEEQIRARDNEHRQRQLEEDKARRTMGDTITDLQHKLTTEIDNNKQREEEERRHREREAALAQQISIMQQKQLELQQAIDNANALGDQVRDRELQLRQTEEALALLKDHLMAERNEQTALQQERLAEEHQRMEKERREAEARAKQQQEDADRLANTQKELQALKDKALAAERERAEQKAAEEKERKKNKEDRAERRKAQERLKEAEEAIVALQAQLLGNAGKGSAVSSSAPTPRALSANRRAGSRIPANGRNSPSVVNRGSEGKSETPASPLPPLAPPPTSASHATERKRDADEGDSDFEYQARRYSSQPLASSPTIPQTAGNEEEVLSEEAIQSYLAPSFGATVNGSLEVSEVTRKGQKEGEGFEVDDMLLEANGSPLTGLRQLYELVKERSEGDLLIINVFRGGAVEPVTVELRNLRK